MLKPIHSGMHRHRQTHSSTDFNTVSLLSSLYLSAFYHFRFCTGILTILMLRKHLLILHVSEIKNMYKRINLHSDGKGLTKTEMINLQILIISKSKLISIYITVMSILPFFMMISLGCNTFFSVLLGGHSLIHAVHTQQWV